MSTPRPLTARDLVTNAGRLPRIAVATLGLVLLPTVAVALPQEASAPSNGLGQMVAAAAAEEQQPAAPRDPTRADNGGPDDKSKAKVSVSEHMTVDLHVKDEDLSNVLELLSIQTQKNIVASKGVTGKVTATLYGVTFYQALDAILHVNGYGYIENGNFIFVYTNEELKTIQAALKKRVAKEIKLNYLNADDAKEFVTPLLSKDGGEIKINTKAKDFNIPDKSPVGKNDYALTDTMVVFDYEENVKAIEELVHQLDTRPQQVLVEATILQTSLNEANAFGVDFSIIGDVNFLDFINTGGALSAAGALIKGGTGASGQGFSPGDSQGSAVTSTVGGTQGPGGFKVGVIAGDVGIFVRMLDQVTDTVILSNPKILALNRQPARVLVGKRVGYLNTTQTETSTTQSVQFLDTGTQLYFRPFVSTEGEVRMELKPQVSSAEIRTVTDSGGRAVTIPDEVTQELVTNVNVRDGQTVVLGGLFTESSTFTRQQVPWVGDIPILGAAFRGHDDSTIRSEIIFLITPTIVTDTMIAGAADRASADIERVRAGTRQKLLPFSRTKMTETLNLEAEQLAREGKYAEANNRLQRSLSLDSQQPQAYRLRELITGQFERWPDPSLLNSYLDSEVKKRMESIPPATTPEPMLKPHGSVDVPKTNAVPYPQRSETPTKPREIQAIAFPGQANPLFVSTEAASAGPATSNGTSNAASGTNQGAAPATNNGATAPAPTQTAGVEQHSMATPSEPNSTTPSTNPETAPTGGSLVTTSPVVAAATTPSAPNSSDFVAPAPNAANSTAATIDLPTGSPAASPSPVNTASTAPAAESTNPAPTATNEAFANPTSTTPNAAASITVEQAAVKASDSKGESSAAATTGNANATNSTSAANPNTTTNSTNVATNDAAAAAWLSETDKKAVGEVRQMLPGLRGEIELFSLMNSGQGAKLGTGEHDGWADLVDAQIVKNAPVNAYVGGPNASKVVVGEKPDANYHTNYGWIFNPKTGKLWAAGFDASDRPLNKSTTAAAAPKTDAPASPSSSTPKPESTTASVETEGANK